MPWITVPIALAITGAGATAANIYGHRSAGKTNRRALEAQERESVRMAEFERQQLAEQAALSREQLAMQERERLDKTARYNAALEADKTRWNDYLSAHKPMWDFAGGLVGNLADLAGYQGERPVVTAPTAPPLAPPPTNAGPMAEQAPAMDLRSLAMTPRRSVSGPVVAAPPPSGLSLSDLMQMAAMTGSGKAALPSTSPWTAFGMVT